MKKVSVIVPIYKGNNYIPNIIRMLEENWKSANKMEHVEIELILVNDYPQQSLKLENRKPQNISCIAAANEKNCGIHYSRVQGLKRSKGDYILFLDQDDEISPVYIREQLRALGDNDAIICNGKNYSDLIYKTSSDLAGAVDENEYRKGYNRIVSPGQVLLRREAVPSEWMDNILRNNGADDYFLWMLLFRKKRRFGVQEKVLYWHLISDENTSKDGAGMNDSVFEMLEKLRGYLTLKEIDEIKKTRLTSMDDRDISVEEYRKERSYKEMLEMWMLLRDRNISVDRFLSKQNIRKVAIYGGGIFGRHLYHELKQSDIQVECLLDQNKSVEILGIKTIVPGEKMEAVDAIIVTPFMEYIEIREELKKSYPYKIMSIESVLQNADCELTAD